MRGTRGMMPRPGVGVSLKSNSFPAMHFDRVLGVRGAR